MHFFQNSVENVKIGALNGLTVEQSGVFWTNEVARGRAATAFGGTPCFWAPTLRSWMKKGA